ncbi:unnamed protein product, partial [Iphiclides podalirius]
MLASEPSRRCTELHETGRAVGPTTCGNRLQLCLELVMRATLEEPNTETTVAEAVAVADNGEESSSSSKYALALNNTLARETTFRSHKQSANVD